MDVHDRQRPGAGIKKTKGDGGRIDTRDRRDDDGDGRRGPALVEYIDSGIVLGLMILGLIVAAKERRKDDERGR